MFMVHIHSTSRHTLILPVSLFFSVTSQEKALPSFADLAGRSREIVKNGVFIKKNKAELLEA